MSGGREAWFQHRHPHDNIRERYDKNTAAPLSKLHQLTIMSAEQQTHNFYANVGPQYMESIARQLYQEIALVEQEHVTHYESLIDGSQTWFEQLMLHEYNEVYLYYLFMEQKVGLKIKQVWELNLNMEIDSCRLPVTCCAATRTVTRPNSCRVRCRTW